MKRIVALLFAFLAAPLLGLPLSHATDTHADTGLESASACHEANAETDRIPSVDPCPIRCMESGRESDTAPAARSPAPESRACLPLHAAYEWVSSIAEFPSSPPRLLRRPPPENGERIFVFDVRRRI